MTYDARYENDAKDYKQGENGLRLNQYTKCIKSSYMIHTQFGGVEGLGRSLSTVVTGDVKLGVSPSTVEARKEYYGENKLPAPEISTLYEIVMANFDDFINKVLLGACIVSGAIGYIQHGFSGLTEGVSIAIALVLIIAVSSANNYQAEK
jgi:magnesium-transporting ATPase (P-type)